jgi:acetyltransferase-like isoleucine patch superfamily enzyme
MRPYWRHRFAAFGAGSILDRPRWLRGHHKVEIGAGVIILSGAWIAAELGSWDQPGPAITIGDDVAINTGVTITAAESVVIEDGVLMAANVLVIDCDHTMDGPHLQPAYNPLKTAPVRIGRGTWIGQGAAVLRGATIGERCVIGANSVVRGEIPPYSVAVGAPARVVRRYDAATGRWAPPA